MLDPNVLVIESMYLIKNEGSTFRKIEESEVRLGVSVVVRVVLQGSTNEALDLLEATNFNPIQAKWFRKLNYGFVPERNFEKQNETKRTTDLKSLQMQSLGQRERRSRL